MNGRVRTGWAATALAAVTAGCVVAAIGAGAGGGVYFTSRGAEGVVPASLERAASATDRAFHNLKIKRTKVEKTETEQDDGDRKREISGHAGGRNEDVTVTLEAEGRGSTRVQVVARRSAVTWDKDFARAVLEKIVQFVR